jgi:dTDP-4-dehydrorhamnose reductase
MRIIVTGAAGQLAQDLLQRWRDQELLPLSHSQLDITDSAAVERALHDFRPELVVNTAAFHRVDDCEDQPDCAFMVNAVGAYNLARAAERIQARLVHFSTDYVFDGRSNAPYLETDPPGPLSVYATSKFAGERLVERYCSRHFVVRTCGLYGLAGSRSKGGNFVETMLRAASQRKPLRVVADQVVTPTSTSDLAERVALLVQSGGYGLYHMTNTGQCSWHEFAAAIFRLAGVEADLHPVPSAAYGAKARRPAYSVLDNGRLRAAGLPEFRPWQDALEDYVSRRQAGVPQSAR